MTIIYDNQYQEEYTSKLYCQTAQTSPKITSNFTHLQKFNQFEIIELKYNIIQCKNFTFFLKINDTLKNFGIIKTLNYSIIQKINSSSVNFYKVDLLIYNSSNHISKENLVINNSQTIEIIESKINDFSLISVNTKLIVEITASIAACSALLIIIIILKRRKLKLKNFRYLKKVNHILPSNHLLLDVIKSDYILSGSESLSILKKIQNPPPNLDLNVHDISGTLFLDDSGGISI